MGPTQASAQLPPQAPRQAPSQALPARRWLHRLAWLGIFWVAGVAAMGLVALLLRGLMRAVGLAL